MQDRWQLVSITGKLLLLSSIQGDLTIHFFCIFLCSFTCTFEIVYKHIYLDVEFKDPKLQVADDTQRTDENLAKVR